MAAAVNTDMNNQNKGDTIIYQTDDGLTRIDVKGELLKEAVIANFATTAGDGKTYQVDYYSLNVIAS